MRLPRRFRQATQQTERTSQPTGFPTFATAFAIAKAPGNPSSKILALCRQPRCHGFRLRPVVLRPRLSAGLPFSNTENMPNKRRPHKRGVPKLPRRSPESGTAPGFRPQAAHSVKDLLARSVPILKQATRQSARQAFWHPWFSARLPPELPPRITGITERDGTLVVFAESPAWSARLRYALQELQSQIRAAQPDITEVSVRVLPRTKQ
jgi:hypothetical protein